MDAPPTRHSKRNDSSIIRSSPLRQVREHLPAPDDREASDQQHPNLRDVRHQPSRPHAETSAAADSAISSPAAVQSIAVRPTGRSTTHGVSTVPQEPSVSAADEEGEDADPDSDTDAEPSEQEGSDVPGDDGVGVDDGSGVPDASGSVSGAGEPEDEPADGEHEADDCSGPVAAQEAEAGTKHTASAKKIADAHRISPRSSMSSRSDRTPGTR